MTDGNVKIFDRIMSELNVQDKGDSIDKEKLHKKPPGEYNIKIHSATYNDEYKQIGLQIDTTDGEFKGSFEWVNYKFYNIKPATETSPEVLTRRDWAIGNFFKEVIIPSGWTGPKDSGADDLPKLFLDKITDFSGVVKDMVGTLTIKKIVNKAGIPYMLKTLKLETKAPVAVPNRDPSEVNGAF